MESARRDGMPWWLRPFVPFFPHPSVGAGRVLEAATRDVAPGSFLHKGKVQPLPFADRAGEVLRLVEALALADARLISQREIAPA